MYVAVVDHVSHVQFSAGDRDNCKNRFNINNKEEDDNDDGKIENQKEEPEFKDKN